MIPECKLSSAGKEFITDTSKLNSNGDQTRQVTLNLLCMVVYVVRWDENELMAQDFKNLCSTTFTVSLLFYVYGINYKTSHMPVVQWAT